MPTDPLPSALANGLASGVDTSIINRIENGSIDDWDPYGQLSATGLKRFAGNIFEEFLPALRDEQSVEVYREMGDNDPVVAAMLQVIEMLLRQVDWDVVEGEGSDSAKARDFIEECRDDMDDTWENFLSEVLSMLRYGWSFHELVYKRRNGHQKETVRDGILTSKPSSRYDDGKVGWHRMSIMSQDTLLMWQFDRPTGKVLGMWQLAPPDYDIVFVPWTKALHFRPSSFKGNPQGRSILRSAYRPWYFKKRLEEIEAIGIERDLAGLPIAWLAPEYFTASDQGDQRKAAIYTAVEKIVTNVRRDEQEGILFPLAYDEKGNRLFDFSLLSTGGTRQFDISGVIARYDQRILMSALADFILLGHENTGSFALSSDRTDLFAIALKAWIDAIADVLNRQAIPRLLRLNGMPTEDPPQFHPSDIETPNLVELSQYIQALAAVGVPLMPDEDTENYLRRVANLPPRSGELGEMPASEAMRVNAEIRQPLALPAGQGGPGQPGGAGGQQKPSQRPQVTAGSKVGRPQDGDRPTAPATREQDRNRKQVRKRRKLVRTA